MNKLIRSIFLFSAVLFVLALPTMPVHATETDSDTTSDTNTVSTGRFSQEELNAVYNEIVDKYYLNDDYADKITSVGIMYGATENGKPIMFSDDFSELRVVVSVNSMYFDELDSLFHNEYEDIVFVESIVVVDPSSEYIPVEETNNENAANTTSNDESEANSAPRAEQDNHSQGYKTGIQVAVGIVLIIIIITIIIIDRKKKKE